MVINIWINNNYFIRGHINTEALTIDISIPITKKANICSDFDCNKRACFNMKKSKQNRNDSNTHKNYE